MDKMISKRIKSVLLAMTMLVSLTASAIAVTAENEPGGTSNPSEQTKIPLNVEYMGKGSTPLESGTSSAHLDEHDITSDNGQFWVGLSACSSDGLKMSDTNLKLFTEGIYSFEVAFAYNSKYITPYYKRTGASGVTFDERSEDWKEALTDANTEESNSATGWSGAYSFESAIDVEISSGMDCEDLFIPDAAASDWKMCVVNIKFNETNAADQRFYGFTDDDVKQYLVKLPFTLLEVPNPLSTRVLKLVRGPEMFNIGSGAKGGAYRGTWEKQDTEYAEMKNLKNVFGYGGDIVLFGTGDTITDMKVQKYVTEIDEETEEEVTSTVDLEMRHERDNTSSELGFDSMQSAYYVDVDSDIDKVKIFVESSDAVTVNGDNADTDGISFFKDVELQYVDPDTYDTDKGYNNVIVVESGGIEYTVYVRRLRETTVVFNPGNSPFGLIERMRGRTDENGLEWTDEVIEAAKEAFVNVERDGEGNVKKNAYAFSDEYLPEYADADVTYWDNAWNEDETTAASKPVENQDINPDAFFIYHHIESDEGIPVKIVTDPGIVAYDITGKKIENLEYTRKVYARVMPSSSADHMGDDDAPLRLFDEAEGKKTLFEQLTFEYIRPGVYDLVYTFTDPVSGENCEFKRPLIYLWEWGDTNLSGVFNGTDANYITQILKSVVNPLDGLDSNVSKCLYYYRILDTNNSMVFNGTDANYITQVLRGVSQKHPFYYEITE